jgi:fido (protein-threonine AMPylation protein)
LIGTDYFTNSLLLDEEELRRINPFDWATEFPEIMKKGGFDAVIGNPPYVRQESLSGLKGYFKEKYQAFDSVADLFTYFLEKGAQLLRENGRLSFIVSSSFLRTTYAESLRRFIKNQIAVSRIVDFGGLPIFENAKDTYVCIPLLVKSKQPERVEICRVHSLNFDNLDDYVQKNKFRIPSERLAPESWSLQTDKEADVFQKIMKIGKPLGDYVKRRFYRGVTTGFNEAFVIDSKTKKLLISQDKNNDDLIKPLLGGQDIRRYHAQDSGLWLIFTRRGVKIKKYPTILNFLMQWKDALTPKRTSKDKIGRKPGRYEWYEIQDDVAYFTIFEQPKIIFPDICKGPRFFLDRTGKYLTNTGYALGVFDPYLLGILNSRLFWFAISHISIPFGVRAGEFRYRLIYQYMEKVPIKKLDTGNELDQAKGKRLRELVEQMLVLHEKRPFASAPHDQIRLQRQIKTTDREIDRVVYDLYELTDEEIAIVEGTAVASSEEPCDNDVHEHANSIQSGSALDQTAPMASSAQYAREGGRGSSAGAQGTGDPVHGIREPTPHYGSSGSASGDSPEELGSTRYFTTSQGPLSYTQLAERLGVNLAGLLERLLHIPPVELEISTGWLCERHKELAGDLFPDWAGRYRDLNVQVGQHTPPPYYEVPTYMRMFCDDLRARLHHLPPESANVQELAAFLAWVDWRFQWIHPFKDFNGRIGRVLLAALLYKLALPHVETAPLAGDVRQPYLSALRAADEGDLVPLTDVWLYRLAAAL